MKKECFECRSWIPHFQFAFVGFCIATEEFVFKNDFCEFFELKELEKDFIWCSVCKCEISLEETEYHKSKGHRLFSGVFMDEDYREEIYEG